jgi:hypothetical protein
VLLSPHPAAGPPSEPPGEGQPVPSVALAAPSGPTETTAMLNGSVNPNGLAVSECSFEYGPSASYGASVPCSPSPGSGTSPVAVSASLNGLSANTTYHYRLVAKSSAGKSATSDATVTTNAPPPTVTLSAASGVSTTAATVNGSVDPNGVSVSDCHFEYGTSASYGASAQCSPSPGSGTATVAVAAPLGGLSPNTSYHYRVVATGPGGTSASGDGTFTTPPLPPAVGLSAASGVTQAAATLNGSVDPNGVNVSDCHLEYGTSASYGASTACSPAPGAGSTAVAVAGAVGGLSAETTYHYRLVATSPGGPGTSGDATFTTLPPPPSVSAASPGAGLQAGGATVTVTGRNLAHSTQVKFGGAAAKSFTVESPTQVTAVAPGGSGTVDVMVANAGGSSEPGSAHFMYVPPGPAPVIRHSSPNYGSMNGGTTVTILGNNFVGVTSVKFGSVPATSFAVRSSKSLTAVAPAERRGTVVKLFVTTPNGTNPVGKVGWFKFTRAALATRTRRAARHRHLVARPALLALLEVPVLAW